MIKLEGVSARAMARRGQPASRIANVTLAWESGVLALLGAPADGTTALLEVLAGAVPARGGQALVLGKSPELSRARIAYVPVDPALPDALRVDEVCELAARVRGEPALPAAARLAPLGLERLADRRVKSLSPGEVRAVALAIALTSKAPVLLVAEPLVGLDPSAPTRVIEALRARASAGAAVIVTTSSVRDATRLGDQLGMLTQGIFTHLPPSLAHVGVGGARLRVVVAASAATDVAPFVAALAAEPAIGSIETAAYAATRALHAAVAVLVSGADLLGVARAIAGAAAKTGVAVEAIESAVIPLEAIRARIAAPHPGVLLSSRPPPLASTSGSLPPSSPPLAPSAAPPPPAPSQPPRGTA